ncbi:MAG: hypothetical protein U1E52_20110 [Geminicoccaceae bacterium]
MRILAAIATFLALYLTHAGVRAADLSGVWVIDEPVWQQQVDRLVGTMLGQMPPEALAKMKEQGMDPVAAMKEGMTSALSGTVEFLPDGRVRTTTKEDGQSEDARWQLDGNALRIMAEDAGEMTGRVEGDRITLHPVVDDDDPEHAMLRDLEFPLVRQQ